MCVKISHTYGICISTSTLLNGFVIVRYFVNEFGDACQRILSEYNDCGSRARLKWYNC